MDLATKKTYQVTSTKLGAYQPSVSADGKQLIYSEFSSLGYDLMLMDVNQSDWREIQPKEVENLLSYYKVLEEQEGGSIVSDVPNEEFEVSKFNKISGLVNLHSWNPVVSDAFDPEGGVELVVQNKISTFSATGSYVYNASENVGTWRGEVAYGEFFPILRAGFSETQDRSKTIFSTFVLDDTLRYRGFGNSWDEQIANFGVTIPLNLTAGNTISDLEFLEIFWLSIEAITLQQLLQIPFAGRFSSWQSGAV